MGKRKEIREFELSARYDVRKSFYGKAKVRDYEDGKMELYSYGTLVSVCNNGEITHLGRWSQTTSRHQREFEKQFAR